MCSWPTWWSSRAVSASASPGHNFFRTAGVSIDGRFIEDVFPPAMYAVTRAYWNAVAETSAPSLGRGRVLIPGKQFLEWEGIVLPLGGPSGPAEMLMGAVVNRPNVEGGL